jgi:hypothetical protein
MALTSDQQMFIYRWYPVMGAKYCASEIEVPQADVVKYAKERNIPGLQQDYEYTIQEIADRLGLTMTETKTILYAGLRKIRRAFKEKLNEKSNIKYNR